MNNERAVLRFGHRTQYVFLFRTQNKLTLATTTGPHEIEFIKLVDELTLSDLSTTKIFTEREIIQNIV